MNTPQARIYIACGGTGGHLYPGMAIASELRERGQDATLLISPKEIDQQAARSNPDFEFATLPAVGMSGLNFVGFCKGFWRSYQAARALYQKNPPLAVVAMGGFTSAPPVFAARRYHAVSFLHEANAIPGRANRWLARWVQEAFVHFPSSAARLKHVKATPVGMPVRPQFQDLDPAACRMMLGLDPQRPVLLIMGGSQGASAINELVIDALPHFTSRISGLQYIHLTGPKDEGRVKAAYERLGCKALVRPFLTEMELAMGAATAAISRAGASSLAEVAALRLPVLLIPYPHAADNHQFYNALEFVETGAARLMAQSIATPGLVYEAVNGLLNDEALRNGIREALGQWHKAGAAAVVADRVMVSLGLARPQTGGESSLVRGPLPVV